MKTINPRSIIIIISTLQNRVVIKRVYSLLITNYFHSPCHPVLSVMLSLPSLTIMHYRFIFEEKCKSRNQESAPFYPSSDQS